MKWNKRPAIVQAGDYVESNTTVTQWVSQDGRFTITPTGSVTRRREFGVRGQLLRKFRWHGYRLVDTTGASRPARLQYTVTDAKRTAERILRGGIA